MEGVDPFKSGQELWKQLCVVAVRSTSASCCWITVAGSRKQNHIFEWLQDEDFHHHWSFPNVVWGLSESVELHVSKRQFEIFETWNMKPCSKIPVLSVYVFMIWITVGLYALQVIKSRRMGWAGHVAHMGEQRGACRVLVGKPEGKRPLGRPRRRWVDNIKMDLQVVGCGYVDWIGLAQDRDRWRTLVSAVMNLLVP